MVLQTLPLPPTLMPVIKFHGFFDYKKVYRGTIKWLEGQDYEVHEYKHKHKVGVHGPIEEIDVRAWRKVNDYAKFWMFANFRIWGIKEVEIEENGIKKKMTRGRIEIEYNWKLDLDFNNKFQGKFGEILQQFLHRYIWRQKIESGWEDEIYYRMYKWHNTTKGLLGMETTYNASEGRY